MGQRLVVDLIENDEVVAAVYYHWSAYFTTTIYELAKLSEAILKAKKENKNELLAVIECLEEKTKNYREEDVTGGIRGTPEEFEVAKMLFPNHKFETELVDRSYGIISLTKDGIQSYHDREEGHAEINLDTLEISNSVTLDADPFEFVDASYEEEDGEKYFAYAETGKIKLNGHICEIDAFDCTCEEMVKLAEWMEQEWEVYNKNNPGRG